MNHPNVLKIFTFAQIFRKVRVHNDLQTLQLYSRPVISFGIFDGVHRGHLHLISQVRDLAAQTRSESLIMTFWPHPRIVLNKIDDDFRLLTTLEEKISLIRNTGVDHLLIVAFSLAFAGLSPAFFLDEYFGEALNPSKVVVGADVRFGARGEGNRHYLEEAGKRMNFEVLLRDSLNAGDIRISSTHIRSLLRSGDLENANQLLGYPFMLTGHVGSGRRIGRSIGFPTANIEYDDHFKQLPADGVYAVLAEYSDGTRPGMLNIGFRPTIDDSNARSIEVHLFDVDDDLYGQNLTVRFIKRLRDEMKFADLAELQSQLSIDRINALNALKNF